jgi:superfamily II DNA or RNA helicase
LKNLVRNSLQDQAYQKLEESNFNGIILATVGFGKSRVICLSIEKLYKKGNRKFLYACDSERLRDIDFPNELKKWLPIDIFNNIDIECVCYQTCYRWKKSYDVLIADEFDMSITPAYIKTYLNNQFKHKLLFSGTLSPSKKQIAVKIAPIVFVLKTKDAEDKNIINKTEYYLYNFRMTDEESKEYTKLTKKIKQLLKIQTPLEDKTLQFWMRKRKHFLNKLESSARHCRRLVSFLEKRRKENRIVVFCELTEQADRVCDYSFHGENEKDDMLTEFQTGAINKIAVVQKVKRGINLKKTNCGIFESLPGGSSTEFEQRSGRLKRLAVDELALIIFMLPWVKATKGEDQDVFYKPSVVQDWIKRATSNIPNIKLQILKL